MAERLNLAPDNVRFDSLYWARCPRRRESLGRDSAADMLESPWLSLQLDPLPTEILPYEQRYMLSMNANALTRMLETSRLDSESEKRPGRISSVAEQ